MSPRKTLEDGIRRASMSVKTWRCRERGTPGNPPYLVLCISSIWLFLFIMSYILSIRCFSDSVSCCDIFVKPREEAIGISDLQPVGQKHR